MTKRYKPKNLTLIEVLVVVLVCLFLLAVVTPASRKPRSDSIRMTCAKNLSVIGKAMLIYANDYDGEFPRAGGRNTIWSGRIANWLAPSRFGAYELSADGSGGGGQATITSSFYLLVKYAEVAPKTFVCPGDTGTTEFRPYDDGAGDRELIDLWDFGLEPTRHCSYSYHMPYSLYALTTSSEPGMAVAADRNPWIDSPAAEAKDFSLFNPDGGREAVRAGNAIAHQDEGQNVLFVDGHVSFEKSPFCGLNDDNIYTYWDGGDFRRGGVPIPGASGPEDRSDSFLVNDLAVYRTRTTITKETKSIDSNDLKQTSVIATLDCPVPEHRNVIWCSTFQMAWDKLKNDIIGEPVKVLGAEELAARLNKAEASTGDLEEESFYATAGFVKKGIIEQIQQEMAKRFPSETKPVFDELDMLPLWMKEEAIVAYSYLNVDVGFKYPFHTNKSAFTFQDSNGKRTDVTSFRTSKGRLGLDSEVSEQVNVLYYKRGEQRNTAEYVVDLCKYTSPYQVVLALVPRRNTLRETVAAVEQKINKFKQDPRYEQRRKLRPPKFGPGDSVIVPDVLYKLTHHFEELKGKLIKNQEFLDYWFLVAEQMIDFALSRTGVTLKSQARLVPFPPAGRMGVPRQLYFNRPFLVYVKKRGPDKSPFFVMWVNNAELMKELESK